MNNKLNALLVDLAYLQIKLSSQMSKLVMDYIKEQKQEKTMIKIRESKTADTRTCDVSTVSRETLLASSHQHIEDVKRGFDFIIQKLEDAKNRHDHTKISHIDNFYSDFKTKFVTQEWYKMHKTVERHHIAAPDGVRDDVNIIDLLEFIIDGVMAGLARSGTYRKEDISSELLRKCFDNTVELILSNVEVINE